MKHKLEARPDARADRRCTVENAFDTKSWIGATHFRTRGRRNVAIETSLTILTYNIQRAITVAGVAPSVNLITG